MSEQKREDVVLLSVKRTPTGVQLYVKSEKMEEFFKGFASLGAALQPCPRWKGVSLYPISEDILYSTFVFDTCDLASPGGLLVKDGKANLSFLRAKGLSKGISFSVGNAPVRESYLTSFQDLAKRGIFEIYQAYMSAYEGELLISTEKRVLPSQNLGEGTRV